MSSHMLHVDVQSTGPFTPWKHVHGVNNGPVCYGALVDVSDSYRELGVPYVRLHDTNWPHPREVDVHTIFPDFSRDPGDPSAYDFARTDTYIQSVLNTGARIVYRLGESIEHTEQKYFIHPPADFAKWAEICAGIIRHYNHGWASGFQHNIQHWEIWNEPESFPHTPPEKNAMWSGTQEQYLDLYRIASQRIKQLDPTLKVGGPAYTMVHDAFLHKFLGFCRDQRLPLDFFSWHTYADSPAKIQDNAHYIKRTLNSYGFGGVEIHLNEWNYTRVAEGERIFGLGNAASTAAVFERSKNEEGASFVAAVLMLLQDLPVDIANFYDGAPTSFWSLFNQYGVPQKNCLAFRAFKQLIDHSERVSVSLEPPGSAIVVAAGRRAQGLEMAVLISHHCSISQQCRIASTGFSTDSTITRLVIDASHNLERQDDLAVLATGNAVELTLARFSVNLLLFSAPWP